MSTKPEFYTSDQAAEELGCSGRWVRHLLKIGELKGHKVGRNWIITRDDLEEYKRRQSSQ